MRRAPATLLLLVVAIGLAGLAACETQPAPPDSGDLDLATPTVVHEAPTPTPLSSPATQTPPTSTPTSEPTQEPVLESGPELSITVAPVAVGFPAYDRDEWHPRWRDEDSNCKDTRQEVLVAESVGVITFKSADECRVAMGEWHGKYTGLVFTNPGDLDVDHFVPLANAHRSGGWAWDKVRKQAYANDLSYAGHLIAVQNSANRSKDSRGPEDWRPKVKAYWCQYATDWVTIKNNYGLTATQAEFDALAEMLGTCMPSILLLSNEDNLVPTPSPISTPGPAVSPGPSPAPKETYASCDEAEAAGLERVRGSRGNGRGFPASAVPSTRDGDGDGVVCEE